MMTLEQVDPVLDSLKTAHPVHFHIRGRVADAGCDPLPIMSGALESIRSSPQIELIWASPRELFNIGRRTRSLPHHTVTHDLLRAPLLGKDLDEYSLDTVKMFVTTPGQRASACRSLSLVSVSDLETRLCANHGA